jgi:phage terminase large subunit GpA-like protein
MRAVRIMLFDECDKYPLNVGAGEGGSGGEGDPIQVAWGRATTYGNRAKKIVACSPTVEDRSRIEQEYLKSDQREYYQPCPHCNHAEVLDWHKHVNIPEDENGNKEHEKARIICGECGTEWNEADHAKSIKNGYWVAQKPHIKDHHGYRVSALASPFISVQRLAKEFVNAEGNPEAMKAFINTRLARTFKETGDAPDWKRLYERRESYPIATVPAGGLMLTCGIDVQKDYLIYEVVAWGKRKRSWSVDTGVIDGHISEDETKDQLRRFIDTRYTNTHGIEMPLEMICIDSSNDTTEVYSTVANIGTPRLRAIKGVGSLNTITGNPKPAQINVDGVRRDGGIKMWPLGVNVLKEEFYKWLMLERPTDESLAEGVKWPTGYCHFPEWGEDYFQQITAEILIERKDNKGYLVRVWEKLRANHLLDCRIYARAGAAMLMIDRMIDEDWTSREKRYGSDVVIEHIEGEKPVLAAPQKPTNPNRKKRPKKWFGSS